MDQPSLQHGHVVTIPSATDDSSVAFSTLVALGFQALNSPRQGVPTDLSTSGAANTQGRSRAPRQRRSRWSNPCSWLIFECFSTSIQTILLVVFLRVFRDEHAHKALQAWVIGSGAGRLICGTYKRLREQSNRLPQAVPVSPGSEVGETRTGRRQRFGKILLMCLWRALDEFIHLWFGVGTGIVYTRWRTGQAPHLNWLCTVFLVIAYFHYILLVTFGIIMYIWCGIEYFYEIGPEEQRHM